MNLERAGLGKRAAGDEKGNQLGSKLRSDSGVGLEHVGKPWEKIGQMQVAEAVERKAFRPQTRSRGGQR